MSLPDALAPVAHPDAPIANPLMPYVPHAAVVLQRPRDSTCASSDEDDDDPPP